MKLKGKQHREDATDITCEEKEVEEEIKHRKI